MSHTLAEQIKSEVSEVVVCQDCGGYISDHQGVLGDCNYEAGEQTVDELTQSLLALIRNHDTEKKQQMLEAIDYQIDRVEEDGEVYINRKQVIEAVEEVYSEGGE